MPPESIWTAILRIAVPAILAGAIGAGIALYGVRLTNAHNAAENAANREHAAKMWDIETRQKAKREHHEAIITEFMSLEKAAGELETNLSSPERRAAAERLQERLRSFEQRLHLSCLFIPEAILEAVSRAFTAFSASCGVSKGDDAVPAFSPEKKRSFKDEFIQFTVAARKDLRYED
jgi:hypothetical protein